jgi:heat shock protein HtpX
VSEVPRNAILDCDVFEMQAEIKIAPNRSVAACAILTVLSIVGSYVFLLLIAAACISLPYLAYTNSDHLPAQAWALAGGSVIVGLALLWSIIPRRDKFAAPGMRLGPENQPKLFDEIRGVACALGEPVPVEVYLIDDANAFVADRGGMLGFGNRRIMAIGLPLLSLLTVSELRAMLGHEFAHFYSGDTSLGPWIYRTRTAFVRTFQNVGSLKSIGRIAILRLLLLVVSHVLIWYFKGFMRVTNFISRKQEFRSDELGKIVAGKQAMISTLEKIHTAGMFWHVHYLSEVSPIVQENFLPPIGEGFVRFVESPEISQILSELLKNERASSKADPYDSHPPLAERLAALQEMDNDEVPFDARPASSLLSDLAALEMQFIGHLSTGCTQEALRPIVWGEVGEKVVVPNWRAEVAGLNSELSGKAVDSVPDLLDDLARMGEKLYDANGKLLSPSERRQRAANLLSCAVGLLLVAQGWRVEATPGHFELKLGEQGIKPGEIINDLASKKLTREGWNEMCRAWGISGMLLCAVKLGDEGA